jgi:hypothetical protein
MHARGRSDDGPSSGRATPFAAKAMTKRRDEGDWRRRRSANVAVLIVLALAALSFYLVAIMVLR